MIEDLHSVLNRISEIKKRFGIKRHNPDNSVSYSKFHNDAIKSLQEKDKIGTANDISKIEGKSFYEINRIADFYAEKNKIPSSLVKSVIEVESGYNTNAVSRKGAKGLMQLMPSVMKYFGVSDPYLPKENIRAGTGLLKSLLKDYNWDYKKALAAYNAGKVAVDRRNGVPDYKETKDYVRKVIQSYLKNSK